MYSAHIPGECFLVCAELERVEAVVSGEIASKVLGDSSAGQPERPFRTTAGDTGCLSVDACAEGLRRHLRESAGTWRMSSQSCHQP